MHRGKLKEEGALFAVAMLSWVVASVWRGYIFATIWGWFFVTKFGFPPISVPLAVGVGLAISLFQGRSNTKEDWSALGDASFKAMLYPLFVLCFAWFVKLFM